MGERGRSREGHQDVTRPTGPRGRLAGRSEVRQDPRRPQEPEVATEVWREAPRSKGGPSEAGKAEAHFRGRRWAEEGAAEMSS